MRLVLPDRRRSRSRPTAACSRADRVDPGTKHLLLEAPAPPATGTFVDLGCGYGPDRLHPRPRGRPTATVWAVDVNQRARDLCGATPRPPAWRTCDRALPDDVPADLRFDQLWSNPPIRIGKAALHELLATWLGRLTPDGAAPSSWSRSTSAPTRCSGG